MVNERQSIDEKHVSKIGLALQNLDLNISEIGKALAALL